MDAEGNAAQQVAALVAKQAATASPQHAAKYHDTSSTNDAKCCAIPLPDVASDPRYVAARRVATRRPTQSTPKNTFCSFLVPPLSHYRRRTSSPASLITPSTPCPEAASCSSPATKEVPTFALGIGVTPQDLLHLFTTNGWLMAFLSRTPYLRWWLYGVRLPDGPFKHCCSLLCAS